MLANTTPNGEPNGAPKCPGSNPKAKATYDPTFTDRVIAATGPEAHPRVAEIMPSLLRHLHHFAREVDLTVAEWSAAVDFVSARPFPSVTHQKLHEYPSQKGLTLTGLDQCRRPNV